MKAYRDETTGRWHSDLPDVFHLICEKLRNGERFSFARYGDGEWNAIYGKQGANCDGHEYFKDLGANLKYAVENQIGVNNVIMGLQPLTIASDRINQIEKDFPNIDWVDADCIHNASIDGKLELLFTAIWERDCTLVGPNHLKNIAEKNGFDFIEIPSINCWNEYERISNSISEQLDSGFDRVVLLCASMISEVIIHEFHDEATFIDLGSVLDPYCGVKSRRYHHKLTV